MSVNFSTRSLLPVFVALSVLVSRGRAFVIPSTIYSSTHQRHNEQAMSPYNLSPRDAYSVSLSAKKRRRRRQKGSPPSNEQRASPESPKAQAPAQGVSNELPDFDLDDGEGEEQSRKKINPDEITANMMASGISLSRPLDELIMDRSLENKLEFEEKADPSVPDFVDLAKASSTIPSYNADSALTGAGVGKKKQRQAERMARAIAAKEEEEEDMTILERNLKLVTKYFPQFLDEKGNFSGVKLLENGAWVGIYSLVGWEVYINSPFFDRAAPLAPVVFEILM